MLNCIYSDPVYWDRAALDLLPLDSKISELDNWNYRKMECSGNLDYSTTTFPAYVEKISSSTNEFFLEKNISYGDFLIIVFLILIFLGLTIGGIREFAKNRKLERL